MGSRSNKTNQKESKMFKKPLTLQERILLGAIVLCTLGILFLIGYHFVKQAFMAKVPTGIDFNEVNGNGFFSLYFAADGVPFKVSKDDKFAIFFESNNQWFINIYSFSKEIEMNIDFGDYIYTKVSNGHIIDYENVVNSLLKKRQTIEVTYYLDLHKVQTKYLLGAQGGRKAAFSISI